MKDKKATILIDLKQTEDEIFKKFSKDLRWGIRRAEKENLIFKETNRKIDWNIFLMIYRRMWWSVTPKMDHLVNKWEKDKSRRLFFVYKIGYDESELIVGFAIVKNLPDRLNMEYLAPAHENYIKWRINDYVHWNLIKIAKKENKPYFDLGGFQLGAIGKTDKVNKYKEQFNGELVITEVRGNWFYILGRKIVRRFPWITRMIKKMKGYKFND